MRTNTFFMATLLVASAIAACATSDSTDATADATFDAVMEQVIVPRCTFSSCHANPTNAAQLDLTPARACDTLISQPSCLFPDRMRVMPGRPEDSFFFHKLTGQGLDETPTGSCSGDTNTNHMMPYGAAALSDDDLTLVHNWIAAGAQCTPSGTGGTTTATGPTIASFTSSRAVPLAGETFAVTLTLDKAAPEGGQMITLEMDQNVISAPVQMMVPAAATSVRFDAYALRPTSRFTIRAHAGKSTKDFVLRIGGLEIAEVLADPTGADDQVQWIKLHNRTTLPIDLNNYSLKAGQRDYDLVSVGLSGTIPAGGCVVIGGPVQSASNSEPIYSQAIDFSPDLPHGDVQAAGFAVFENTRAAVNGVATPVDTMLVGAGNASKLLGPDAEIASSYCGTPAAGLSALRTGPGTCVAAQMQPRSCN